VCRLIGSLSQWMAIGDRGLCGTTVQEPVAVALKQVRAGVTVQGRSYLDCQIFFFPRRSPLMTYRNWFSGPPLYYYNIVDVIVNANVKVVG